jgi:hypothetical protein
MMLSKHREHAITLRLLVISQWKFGCNNGGVRDPKPTICSVLGFVRSQNGGLHYIWRKFEFLTAIQTAIALIHLITHKLRRHKYWLRSAADQPLGIVSLIWLRMVDR